MKAKITLKPEYSEWLMILKLTVRDAKDKKKMIPLVNDLLKTKLAGIKWPTKKIIERTKDGIPTKEGKELTKDGTITI